ncbi:winged helix-turn-helix domain-containing protein [Serratia symbiotica]|uniref:Uncharacterized protein n=1 Tax=Serratia symbiotica TaxID=138074 RepID=A0A7D5T9G6_9GAMM|nr:hypothetical protein [Serratia symbiotica]MBF1996225.1 hypothetical protein [Serratia symbiotica]MBQ0954648.1 hypothetical protein [Serratia symbiotica]QLH63697.1 hypothetical protein SYMBAF_13190 [Serratia symbiotica]QTP14086.1 hypothetical protein GPZ83_0012005 [Serratia symbiotica]
MANNEETLDAILLSNGVVFDPLKRTLAQDQTQTIVTLSENEVCLLKMLLTRTCNNKREIMHEVWEKRGLIVTESSYYKLVRQLRISFEQANLDGNLIKTLPRIGITYVGTNCITVSSSSVSNEEKINGFWYMEKSVYNFTILTLSLVISALCLYLYIIE